MLLIRTATPATRPTDIGCGTPREGQTGRGGSTSEMTTTPVMTPTISKPERHGLPLTYGCRPIRTATRAIPSGIRGGLHQPKRVSMRNTNS